MEKLELVPICMQDIDCFDGTEYGNLSAEKRTELIKNSENSCYNGQFFRLFLLKLGDELIGFFNVYAQSDKDISIAPEIKAQYRRKGFGEKGLILALKKAKELGYERAIATIVEDNTASINLHKKLNFEFVKKREKNGKCLSVYVKML